MGASTRARDRVGSSFYGEDNDLYQLGSKLGDGGQGTAYRCKRLSTNETFAAKVINTQSRGSSSGSSDNDMVENVEQEVRNMRRLKHPNIIRVVEDLWEDGERIILMDLAHGDLNEKVSKELQWSSRLGMTFPGLGRSEIASRHVVRQLLSAISHMHRHGVIHRDLKLENILVVHAYPVMECIKRGADPLPTELLEVKIGDFGLSKYMGDQPHLTRCNTMVGTPDFVAPEVLARDYDMKADFWSLGIVLYVMLCGALPFKIRKKGNLAQWHAMAIRNGVTESRAWQKASVDARDLISGLLTTNPDSRFDLEACLQHDWLEAGDDAQLQAAVQQLGALEGLELCLMACGLTCPASGDLSTVSRMVA